MPVLILILLHHFECHRSYFSKVSKQTKCAELHQKFKSPTPIYVLNVSIVHQLQK